MIPSGRQEEPVGDSAGATSCDGTTCVTWWYVGPDVDPTTSLGSGGGDDGLMVDGAAYVAGGTPAGPSANGADTSDRFLEALEFGAHAIPPVVAAWEIGHNILPKGALPGPGLGGVRAGALVEIVAGGIEIWHGHHVSGGISVGLGLTAIVAPLVGAPKIAIAAAALTTLKAGISIAVWLAQPNWTPEIRRKLYRLQRQKLMQVMEEMRQLKEMSKSGPIDLAYMTGFPGDLGNRADRAIFNRHWPVYMLYAERAWDPITESQWPRFVVESLGAFGLDDAAVEQMYDDLGRPPPAVGVVPDIQWYGLFPVNPPQ